MLKSLGSCMNIDKRLYLRRIVGMELEFCKVFITYVYLFLRFVVMTHVVEISPLLPIIIS